MNSIAQRFLVRCFLPKETVAILLRRENPRAVAQRVVRLETALEPRYQAWLAYENSTGANIYVAANPLRSGSRKRTKENIASVRHLYLDIDTDGDARLAALRASDDVPTPTAILSTSPGKYQVLWRVEGFDFERQEQTLKLLAIAFGGDPACTDCNRVLRIPGFLNQKYDPAHHVTVEYPDDTVWTPADFRLEVAATKATAFPLAKHGRKPPRKHSNSESDWAWVSGQLRQGKDATKLTRELASRRSDKPNPIYYARRTVDVASAHLWLLEGIRIDDVITMLECRLRFDIPGALCSARAREIAATAERMIQRRAPGIPGFSSPDIDNAAAYKNECSANQNCGGRGLREEDVICHLEADKHHRDIHTRDGAEIHRGEVETGSICRQKDGPQDEEQCAGKESLGMDGEADHRVTNSLQHSRQNDEGKYLHGPSLRASESTSNDS